MVGPDSMAGKENVREVGPYTFEPRSTAALVMGRNTEDVTA